MPDAAILLLAFLAGLTLCGLSGSVLEIAAGARLGFRPPFVSPNNIPRSLGATLLAGPFMLLNEALAAWRQGALGLGGLFAAISAAAVWHLATGIVAIELALAIASLLGS